MINPRAFVLASAVVVSALAALAPRPSLGASLTPMPRGGSLGGPVSSAADLAARVIEQAQHTARIRESLKVPVGTARPVVTLTREITRAGLGGAAARGIAGGAAGVAVSVGGTALICKFVTGSWSCASDVPKAEVQGECWKYFNPAWGTQCFESRQEVYEASVLRLESEFPHNIWVYTFLVSDANFIRYSAYGCPKIAGTAPCMTYNYHMGGALASRPWIYKCPQGTFTYGELCHDGVAVPAEVGEVIDKLTRAIPAGGEAALLEQLLDQGVDVSPELSTGTLAGPATATEPVRTVTTTTPGGSPVTTTVNTTHNITYQGNTYNYSSVVVTVHPDGSETVEETAPEQTECEKNPSTVGCKELGDPPDIELPTDEKPISVSPDTGWGADGGVCPPPPSFTFMGYQGTFDNTGVCDFFIGVRPAVVAAFTLAAVFVFIGGFKQ